MKDGSASKGSHNQACGCTRFDFPKPESRFIGMVPQLDECRGGVKSRLTMQMSRRSFSRSYVDAGQPARVRVFSPMAIHVLPILRTLAPLIADAGRIVVGLRSSGAASQTEDRFSKLEQQTIRAGEVLKGVAEQLQALALELRVQAEATEALKRKVNAVLIVSIVALATGLGALGVALWR